MREFKGHDICISQIWNLWANYFELVNEIFIRVYK